MNNKSINQNNMHNKYVHLWSQNTQKKQEVRWKFVTFLCPFSYVLKQQFARVCVCGV